MIDIHIHILPGLDDGAKDWPQTLQMARMAREDGITAMVASPHLYRHRMVEPEGLITKDKIFELVSQLNEKLSAAGTDLKIYPGCDVPLCREALDLLADGALMTIADGNRYLLLEFPFSGIPPAIEDILFNLTSTGITPIITHPERHLIFSETPQKLARLLDLGCLAQLTAQSLTGGFGRHIAKLSSQLVSKGYIQIMATDAHDPERRPPLLREATARLAKIVGESRAWDMVKTVPEKIVRGETF
jgi:protein-tyrosine phosphatase